MAEPERPAPVSWPVAAVVGLVVALAASWWWTREEPAPPPRAPVAAAEHPAPAPTAPAPARPAIPLAEPGAPLVVEPSGRIAIAHDALPSDGPLVVHLRLGEPSADDRPRPVRIAAADGRVQELQGALDADRGAALLELDPAWLTPGVYLVEVKTTERSHIPLRRYVLEVR